LDRVWTFKVADAMWLDELEEMLQHPAPGFACNRPPSRTARHLTRVRNTASRHAPARELANVRDLKVRGADDAAKLYAKYNGFHVFAPTQTSEAKGWDRGGFRLFAIEEWQKRTAEIRKEWKEVLGGWSADDLPYLPDQFIAIGHPEGAWNYVHWIVEGPNAGRIYWWAWTMVAVAREYIAASFPEFISKLCRDPAKMLNDDFGCYTRYYDGVTDTQWVPLKYVSDVSKVAPSQR
jgi:hypothetical protein